ncbi:MAG TPA: hypothetical protein VHU80_19920 [Polyangiaceae bacterium]|nr:hypothetical protein [Polyangiaceae bacterium]
MLPRRGSPEHDRPSSRSALRAAGSLKPALRAAEGPHNAGAHTPGRLILASEVATTMHSNMLTPALALIVWTFVMWLWMLIGCATIRG